MLAITFLASLVAGASAALSDSSLKSYPNALQLGFEYNPVKPAYWTSRPKHRRTPFAISPDGTKAWLAYLDNSETDVHVQQVDVSTFAAVGDAITVTGTKEAGGLVAHNDGFALLTNEPLPSGTTNAPPSDTPVAVLYRYTNGQQTFKTLLGGPTVHPADGLSATPDINGDLVYSEAAGLYGTYIVVTDYQGWAEGHFGDQVQYVNTAGELQTIAGASSSWGCSHNTGIALEAADAAPFASLCAEDSGAIWLNTKTQTMDGVKVSNEHTINGASNEPMGGMSGSYSSLARFQAANSYIFAWVSRGAALLTQDTWRGAGYTQATNRTTYRRVAFATMSDKYTLDQPAAISVVGATNGDAQIQWVSAGPADASNARVATFDGTNALVSWDQIDSPTCTDDAMDCHGTYSGTYYQLISDGKMSGAPIVSTDTFVAGDIVNMPDGRLCWPYTSMTWQLNTAVGYDAAGSPVKQLSFACMTNGDAAAAAPAPASSSGIAATSTSAVSASSLVSATSVASAPSSTSSVAASISIAPVSISVAVPSTSIAVASTSVAAISTTSAIKTTPATTTMVAISLTTAASPTSAILASSASSSSETAAAVLTSAPFQSASACAFEYTTVYV